MAAASRAFSMNVPISDVLFEVGGVWGPISRVTRPVFEGMPSGNFGHVFPALYLEDPVAFKLLPSKPGVSADEAHEAFMAEAENMLAARGMIDRARVLQRVGAPLSEPCELRDTSRRCREPHDLRGWRHIVYVHGVGTIPDLAAVAPGLPSGPAHFVIMEPLTGGSLEMLPRDLLPRPPDVVARAPAELSSGLAALAAAHVVHADVKPENIMLRTPGGELVLTDFGVGRIARGGVNEVLNVSGGPAGGTVLYKAPELLDGLHASTFASDV